MHAQEALSHCSGGKSYPPNPSVAMDRQMLARLGMKDMRDRRIRSSFGKGKSVGIVLLLSLDLSLVLGTITTLKATILFQRTRIWRPHGYIRRPAILIE